MAKRQKTQEAVHTLYLLRPSDFSVHYIISLFKKIIILLTGAEEAFQGLHYSADTTYYYAYTDNRAEWNDYPAPS